MAKHAAAQPPQQMARRLEYMALSALQKADKNPKKHLDKEIGQSIGRFGYVEPIALDERTMKLVAGHGRLHSLKARLEAGEDPPDGVQLQDGEWMVPVYRGWASRSDTEAEAYLLASNQLTIGGGWDNGALAEMLKGLAEQKALEGVGFGDADLSKLLDSVAGAALPADVDEAPEPAEEPYVQLGELYRLGDHLVCCGDCTDVEIQKRVCPEPAVFGLHDPPYGIAVVESGLGDGKRHGNAVAARGKFFPIAGDAQPFEPGHLFASAHRLFLWGANHYADKLPPSAAWAVWDKRVDLPSNGFSDCELAWVSEGGSARIHRHMWNGMIRASERGEKRVHPTQKPVALHAEIIASHTQKGDAVADWYLGSGTTLLACELTGRACRAIELEPRYVQVAIERWEAHTKRKAERL